MRTFVIAEMGSCHDGDIEKAYQLIKAAGLAGVDAVKGQYWSDPVSLAARRNASGYLEIYKQYQVPDVWLSWLKLACTASGVEFMATVYLEKDIPFVDQYVRRHKIASFEAGDDQFVNAVLACKKETIISTGMSSLRPAPPKERKRVKYLHCVSAYPCPHDQASLAVLRSGLFDGYSDHTRYVFTGGLAVAAGAKILEVHFRLEGTDPKNPDYGTALTPEELGVYVELVRKAEAMAGDGQKKAQPAEKEMSKYRVKR